MPNITNLIKRANGMTITDNRRRVWEIVYELIDGTFESTLGGGKRLPLWLQIALRTIDDQTTSIDGENVASLNNKIGNLALLAGDNIAVDSTATDSITMSAKVASNAAVVLNTTHRTSSGINHSDVMLNNIHRTSSGINHSDVVLNNASRHTQGTDTVLDNGQPNQCTAAEIRGMLDAGGVWVSVPGDYATIDAALDAGKNNILVTGDCNWTDPSKALAKDVMIKGIWGADLEGTIGIPPGPKVTLQGSGTTAVSTPYTNWYFSDFVLVLNGNPLVGLVQMTRIYMKCFNFEIKGSGVDLFTTSWASNGGIIGIQLISCRCVVGTWRNNLGGGSISFTLHGVAGTSLGNVTGLSIEHDAATSYSGSPSNNQKMTNLIEGSPNGTSRGQYILSDITSLKWGGGYNTTGNRPASPTNGEMYFDTTLGKPVWRHGSNWVDATGATV